MSIYHASYLFYFHQAQKSAICNSVKFQLFKKDCTNPILSSNAHINVETKMINAYNGSSKQIKDSHFLKPMTFIWLS